MKRRLLSLSLTLLSVALAAAVLYASAAPAAACSCVRTTDDPEVLRSALGDSDALIVEGVIAPPEGNEVENMRITPEVVFSGVSPAEIVLDQLWSPPYNEHSRTYYHLGEDCSASLTGETGDRYLLSLSPLGETADIYKALGCGSYPINNGIVRTAADEYYQESYDLLVAATDGGSPPPGVVPQEEPTGEDKDTPWAVILPLAFGIPLATLIIPALLRRRGGSH